MKFDLFLDRNNSFLSNNSAELNKKNLQINQIGSDDSFNSPEKQEILQNLHELSNHIFF
jgi:hypothetical protein